MDNQQADKIGQKTQMSNTDPTKKPGWGLVPANVFPASYKTPAALLIVESGKSLVGDAALLIVESGKSLVGDGGRKPYVNKNERSIAIWEKINQFVITTVWFV
jgi:hypothetical protein